MPQDPAPHHPAEDHLEAIFAEALMAALNAERSTANDIMASTEAELAACDVRVAEQRARTEKILAEAHLAHARKTGNPAAIEEAVYTYNRIATSADAVTNSCIDYLLETLATANADFRIALDKTTTRKLNTKSAALRALSQSAPEISR